MNRRRVLYAALLMALFLPAAIAKDDDDHHRADAATIAARQKFFGAENVNPVTGRVRGDRVILSWATNTTLAVSVLGDVVLLDTYINRLELPPATGADTRRTPINYQDLVNLHPKAIFLGHGHGDHADNAAYVAKWLNIPIYASPETCDVMQADVARLFNDPNTANGGVKIIPNGDPVTCIPIVSRGSVPGAEIAHLTALEPKACIIAFKHIHSGRVLTDPNFVFVPVGGSDPSLMNTSDSRESLLYPRGTCVTPVGPNVSPTTCLAVGAGNLAPPAPGQVNLETTGFGTIPGSPGGAISFFYDFVLRGHHNFSFVWHNTTGPLKEGVGSDPGLPSADVGAHLFSIMDSLPQTDLELGAILSIGFPTNGVRDAILYQQHIKPQIYYPLHQTDVAALGSSLEYKKTYLLALDANNIPFRPEARWLVDPDDYLRPQVYDPGAARWFTPGKAERVEEFCGGAADRDD